MEQSTMDANQWDPPLESVFIREDEKEWRGSSPCFVLENATALPTPDVSSDFIPKAKVPEIKDQSHNESDLYKREEAAVTNLPSLQELGLVAPLPADQVPLGTVQNVSRSDIDTAVNTTSNRDFTRSAGCLDRSLPGPSFDNTAHPSYSNLRAKTGVTQVQNFAQNEDLNAAIDIHSRQEPDPVSGLPTDQVPRDGSVKNESESFGASRAEVKKRRGKADHPGRCHSCNRSETVEWRRGPDGARTLCNACGMHYAKLIRKMGAMKAAASGFGTDTKNSLVPIDELSTEREKQEEGHKREQNNWRYHSTEDPNIGFAETFYQACYIGLIHLWKLHFRNSSHYLDESTLKIDVASLRLWEANFTTGQLDLILEQCRPLRKNVIENLKGIGEIILLYLMDCPFKKCYSPHGVGSAFEFRHEFEIQLEKAAILTSTEQRSECSSDTESGDSSSDGDSDTTASPTTSEMEQARFRRLHSYIRGLTDLASTIENRANCLEYKTEQLPIPSGTPLSVSASAHPYALRIRDKFKDAEIYLVERLAEANWTRHIRIREQESSEYAVKSSTYLRPNSPLTSHASLMSDSVTAEKVQTRPRVPPVPREWGLFRCDFCQLMVSVRNRVEWKIHVLSDLQSYLCTHPGCEDSQMTFSTRQLWAAHEFNEHFTTVKWHCPTCDSTTSTREQLVNHLREIHSEEPVETAISGAQRAILKAEFTEHACSLCFKSGWESKQHYTSHMGQHLEEISLACLPRNAEYDDDVDSNTVGALGSSPEKN